MVASEGVLGGSGAAGKTRLVPCGVVGWPPKAGGLGENSDRGGMAERKLR